MILLGIDPGVQGALALLDKHENRVTVHDMPDTTDTLYDLVRGFPPVAGDVRDWCAANGGNQDLRIVLAGYDGEHNALEALGWRVTAWKAAGGYGSQSDKAGRENAAKERLWFSPHCLDAKQGRLL